MPYKDPAKTNASHRASHARRKELGICQDCPNVAIEGRVLCAEHREKKLSRDRARYRSSPKRRLRTKESNARRRARALSNGLCGQCHQRDVRPGWKTCQECHDFSQERNKKLRLEALSHYGLKCACCGEGREIFLSIDHVNGGGSKLRKTVERGNTYRWLKDQGWPLEFRTLCYNCNIGRFRNGGTCPHEIERQTRLSLVQ